MAEEAKLEKFLQREVRKRGGMTLKFVSPSVRGVPDQMLIHPVAGTVLIELKAPDGRVHPLQKYMHAKIRRHGGKVMVVSSRAAIVELLDKIGAKS